MFCLENLKPAKWKTSLLQNVQLMHHDIMFVQNKLQQTLHGDESVYRPITQLAVTPVNAVLDILKKFLFLF